MIYNTFFSLYLLFSIFTTTSPSGKIVKAVAENIAAKNESRAESAYNSLNANNFELPSLESFSNAVEGFYDLKDKGVVQKDILTIVDFTMSSNTKRLWVIDMASNTILFNTLVAHGRNTGNEFANAFSNAAESYKSSLGFYSTGDVYNGKHGMSLKLNGLEKGVNDNALNRAVVMHGADYVSESFIKQNSRLGRSLGCPAIPNDMTKPIINTIKSRSCLYIYHPCHCKKKQAQAMVS